MQATSVPAMAGETFPQPFPQEFEDLFQEHYVLVYRTAYGVTGRVEDAEDVVQTIFLRLLKSEKPRELLKNPRGYFYRAAVNLSLTILKTRRRRALTEESEELAVSLPARASSRAEELHHKLYAAIAKLLGTSRGVIAVTLYRSRARLKKLLGPLGDES